jgi:hypothetical protein
MDRRDVELRLRRDLSIALGHPRRERNGNLRVRSSGKPHRVAETPETSRRKVPRPTSLCVNYATLRSFEAFRVFVQLFPFHLFGQLSSSPQSFIMRNKFGDAQPTMRPLMLAQLRPLPHSQAPPRSQEAIAIRRFLAHASNQALNSITSLLPYACQLPSPQSLSFDNHAKFPGACHLHTAQSAILFTQA